MKFTTSFQSSQFDWQLHNEIVQFVANCENFKQTSETVCQEFYETHRNRELSLVATWLKANKLTLHPDKTKFIIFHPSRKKINSSNLPSVLIIVPYKEVNKLSFWGSSSIKICYGNLT